MKKVTRILIISMIALAITLFFTKGVSYARYVTNEAWNYYLESKKFYFTSDDLGKEIVNNVDNSWDLSDIHFNLKNSSNKALATDYDIDYKITCTTDNPNIKCNLNGTGSNTFNGTLSNVKKCVNNSGAEDSSKNNKTDCELAGNTWKSIEITKDLYFNLESKEDIKNATVNIEAESIKPYKKILKGKYILTRNKDLFGSVSMIFDKVNDSLVISNSYIEKKYVKLTFNSNDIRIDTPLENITKSEVDSNGYINAIYFKLNGKNSTKFKFYKTNSNEITIKDFTLIESEC